MTEGDRHGVAGIDEVTAVDVVPVDAQPETCKTETVPVFPIAKKTFLKYLVRTSHDGKDPLEELLHGERLAELGRALVGGVGGGEDGDPHGDGPVEVEQADDEHGPAEHDEAVLVEEDHGEGPDHLDGDEHLGAVEGPGLEFKSSIDLRHLFKMALCFAIQHSIGTMNLVTLDIMRPSQISNSTET